MNKQAYAKLMGLQKKAEELIGPAITPQSVRQQGANLQTMEQALNKRKATEQKERAEIGKGVDAAQANLKRQQANDKKVLSDLKASHRKHEKTMEPVRKNNEQKAKAAQLQAASKTPLQIAQERLAAQKTRNQARLDAVFSNPAALQKYWESNPALREAEARAVSELNKYQEATQKARQSAIFNGLFAPKKQKANQEAVNKFLKQFGLDGRGNLQRMAEVVPGMQRSSEELLGKGIPSLLTVQRVARTGKTTPGENYQLFKNWSTNKAYEDSGFWHRLLAWLQEKWAGLIGGNPGQTQRGLAMAAKDRYNSAMQALSRLGK